MRNRNNNIDEYIDFAHDSMFAYVMRDKDICKGMLKAILPHLNIKDIKYCDIEDSKKVKDEKEVFKNEIEKYLQAIVGKRGVRLDAYIEDDDTVYNIEMQKLDYGDLLLRSRYYQAQVDVAQLKKGADYDELKPVFIIFLCLFDPFGAGRAIYTCSAKCKEDANVNVFDGITKIFINATGAGGEISSELTEVLKYISKAEDYDVSKNSCELVKSIDLAVEDANLDRKLVNGMKTFETELRDREKYGVKKGFEQGIEQGIEQGEKRGRAEGIKKGTLSKAKSSAKNLYKNGVDICIIANSLHYPESTIKSWCGID